MQRAGKGFKILASKPIKRALPMRQEHKQAIKDRLESALQDLYHNATPHYPSLDSEAAQNKFNECFEFWASQEIEYISEGLGCLPKTWAKEARKGFTHNERYFWLVQRITEYGKLYQYGRGGRTLAPSQLVNSRGRVLSIDDISISDMVDMISVLEAFNHYVANWNSKANLLALWQDQIDNDCPGCQLPPTSEVWTTPLDLMCKDCQLILA